MESSLCTYPTCKDPASFICSICSTNPLCDLHYFVHKKLKSLHKKRFCSSALSSSAAFFEKLTKQITAKKQEIILDFIKTSKNLKILVDEKIKPVIFLKEKIEKAQKYIQSFDDEGFEINKGEIHSFVMNTMIEGEYEEKIEKICEIAKIILEKSHLEYEFGLSVGEIKEIIMRYERILLEKQELIMELDKNKEVVRGLEVKAMELEEIKMRFMSKKNDFDEKSMTIGKVLNEFEEKTLKGVEDVIKKVKDFEDKNKKLSEKLRNKGESLREIENQVMIKDKKIQELEEKHFKDTTKIQYLEKVMIVSLEDELKTKGKGITSLIISLESSQKSLKSLQERYKALEKSNLGLVTELAAAKFEIKRVEEKLKFIEQSKNLEIKQLKHVHKEIIESILSDFTHKINEIKLEKLHFQKKAKSFQEELRKIHEVKPEYYQKDDYLNFSTQFSIKIDSSPPDRALANRSKSFSQHKKLLSLGNASEISMMEALEELQLSELDEKDRKISLDSDKTLLANSFFVEINEKLTAENENLKIRIEEINCAKKHLEQQVSSMIKDSSNLKYHTEELEKNKAKIETEIENQDKKLRELSEEYEKIKYELKDQQGYENKNIDKNTIKELEEKVASQGKTIQILSTTIESLSKNNDFYDVKIKNSAPSSEENNENLLNLLEYAKKESEYYKNLYYNVTQDNHQELLKKQTEVISALQTEVEAFQKDWKKSQEKIQGLESELVNLKNIEKAYETLKENWAESEKERIVLEKHIYNRIVKALKGPRNAFLNDDIKLNLVHGRKSSSDIPTDFPNIYKTYIEMESFWWVHSNDMGICKIDKRTKNVVFSYTNDINKFSCFYISPDCQYLVLYNTSDILILQVMEMELQKKQALKHHGINCIKFSENSQFCVFIGTSISVWSLKYSKLINKFTEKEFDVVRTAFEICVGSL
ncbi:hypothetical protein SteCoe_1322 [Stentor coeruleus]|uniref:Uncharacterized protein n=1 Tax=Stentor coeruleus TaxID=5963 RepID=A0A1R2D1X0_9CILI|nr:hypothetical protein SteCoe_1322 [Stentor coeruleus]